MRFTQEQVAKRVGKIPVGGCQRAAAHWASGGNSSAAGKRLPFRRACACLARFGDKAQMVETANLR